MHLLAGVQWKEIWSLQWPSSPLVNSFDEKCVTDTTTLSHSGDKVTQVREHEGEDCGNHPWVCLQQSEWMNDVGSTDRRFYQSRKKFYPNKPARVHMLQWLHSGDLCRPDALMLTWTVGATTSSQAIWILHKWPWTWWRPQMPGHKEPQLKHGLGRRLCPSVRG